MSVWIEIVCDLCAETYCDGSNTPAELRRAAKRRGWSKRVEGGRLNDYRPDHRQPGKAKGAGKAKPKRRAG